MYTCDICKLVFDDPILSYDIEERGRTKSISSLEPNFEMMEYIHADVKRERCPNCGSDQIVSAKKVFK